MLTMSIRTGLVSFSMCNHMPTDGRKQFARALLSRLLALPKMPPAHSAWIAKAWPRSRDARINALLYKLVWQTHYVWERSSSTCQAVAQSRAIARPPSLDEHKHIDSGGQEHYALRSSMTRLLHVVMLVRETPSYKHLLMAVCVGLASTRLN